MKRVYVAGAYSADNVIDVLKNIGRGEYYTALIFKAGFAPFCPWHDKDYVIKNWGSDFTIQEFYNYSLAWLEVSDYLFLVPGWQNSKGTLLEIEFAKNHNIKIFENLTDLFKNI